MVYVLNISFGSYAKDLYLLVPSIMYHSITSRSFFESRICSPLSICAFVVSSSLFSYNLFWTPTIFIAWVACSMCASILVWVLIEMYDSKFRFIITCFQIMPDPKVMLAKLAPRWTFTAHFLIKVYRKLNQQCFMKNQVNQTRPCVLSIGSIACIPFWRFILSTAIC